MRTWFAAALSFAAIVSPVAQSDDPPPASPHRPENALAAAEQEIRATLQSMEQALLRGAPAEVAACYSDDAVIIGPKREEARGRAAVDQYWAGVSGASKWKLDVLSVEGTPAVVLQRGRSDLTFTHNGAERRSVVECLHVWKRDPAGRLRIAVDVYWPASAPVAAGSAAGGDDEAAVRSALRAAYDQWSAARVRCDVAALKELMAPPFKCSLRSGIELDRDGFLKTVSEGHQRAPLERFDVVIQSVEPENGGWAATIQETLLAHVKGADGAPVRVESVWVTRDGWIKTDRGWRATYTKELSSETRFNGLSRAEFERQKKGP